VTRSGGRPAIHAFELTQFGQIALPHGVSRLGRGASVGVPLGVPQLPATVKQCPIRTGVLATLAALQGLRKALRMGSQRTADRSFAAEVDAVLAASRVLIGVAARSLAGVEDTVTLIQVRALVIIASRGPMHLAALADDMGVHPSNATRTCDRLVAAGLLDRRDNPADRRHLLLTLTAAGRELVDSVMRRRRAAIGQILKTMPPEHRAQLATVLSRFAAAGGEPDDTDLWSVGWTTEPSNSATSSRRVQGRPQPEQTG
jgi:DNA-binding MarR family transcriptional regulator